MLTVLPVDPVKATAPEVLTAYCEMVLPIWNEFSPATDTDIEICELELSELIMSDKRPPQPVWNGWSGIELCHWVC